MPECGWWFRRLVDPPRVTLPTSVHLPEPGLACGTPLGLNLGVGGRV